MFCGECGKKIADEARFCPYCGSAVEEAAGQEVYEEVKETEAVVEEQPEEYEEVEVVEEPVYEEEDYEETSSGNGKKTFIIVLLVILIGVGAFFVWKLFLADTKNDQVQATTEATTDASTSDDGDDMVRDDNTEEANGTSTQQDDDLPVVYADASVDYSKPLSTDDYIEFETDYGYSFAYPKDFYNDVYEIDGGYSLVGDDGVSAFEIYKEDNQYSSASDAIEGYYSSAKSSMNIFDEIINAPKSGKLIVGATNSFDSDIYYYYLVHAYEDDVYIMKITYPYSSSESKESENQKNYFVDCMYRYCSFSGGTYKPRTYTQFKNNDMGTKK